MDQIYSTRKWWQRVRAFTNIWYMSIKFNRNMLHWYGKKKTEKGLLVSLLSHWQLDLNRWCRTSANFPYYGSLFQIMSEPLETYLEIIIPSTVLKLNMPIKEPSVEPHATYLLQPMRGFLKFLGMKFSVN